MNLLGRIARVTSWLVFGQHPKDVKEQVLQTVERIMKDKDVTIRITRKGVEMVFRKEF